MELQKSTLKLVKMLSVKHNFRHFLHCFFFFIIIFLEKILNVMPDTLLTFLEGIKGITFLKSLVYLFFVIHKIKKMFHQIS